LRSFPHQNLNRNITFIGDSRARSWPTPSSLNSYSFLNLGVSGHTTSQVLLLFRHLLQSPFKPNIVVIQAGINDLKTLPLFPTRRQNIVDLCQTNIHNLVSLSRKSGARVVVTTIMPVGYIPLLRRPLWSQDIDSAIDDCNQSIRSLKSDNVYIFETSSVLSGPNGRVFPNYQLNSLHINDLGYRALNNELIPMLDILTSKSLTPN
jgi:lysophospholipase L1-like esterase